MLQQVHRHMLPPLLVKELCTRRRCICMLFKTSKKKKKHLSTVKKDAMMFYVFALLVCNLKDGLLADDFPSSLSLLEILDMNKHE